VGMEFRTYTNKGLTRILHEELNNTVVNAELVKRVNAELQDRLNTNQYQMSLNEQVHWIMMDTDFEKVQRVEEFLKLESGAPFITPTVSEIMSKVKDMLLKIGNENEGDYEGRYNQRGNFIVERHIYDGVMCLSFKHVIASWDMDYDAVTSDNYCEPEDEYTG